MSNKTQLQANNAKFDANLQLLQQAAVGLNASQISYNNATSGMTADDVQDAIDELHTGQEAQNEDITQLQTGKAPAYQYSTTDLTEGTSELATGTLYFVYE